MEKEPRKLLFGAMPVVLLLLITLLYTEFFASNSILFDRWMQQLSARKDSGNTEKINEAVEGQEPIKLVLRRLVTGENLDKLEATGFACDSGFYSMVCVANGALRIDTNTMTVHIESNQTIPQDKPVAVRPYARQDSNEILKDTTPVQILHQNITQLPTCDYIHHVPTVIFSSSGFRGNLFHEFNEIIIPLFITSRYFQSNVRFILSDYNPSFVTRYTNILSHLSHYQVINAGTNGRKVHCFPGAVVGLKFHNFLAINSSDDINPGGYSMLDLKQFLRESYHLKTDVPAINLDMEKRPVLLLISRVKSRAFLNEKEMVHMMEELGFRVVVTRPKSMWNLGKFSELVSSCSVMVGAHGAGLTNELFLPAGAVLVQVVPLGLDWASSVYFGEPAKDMGVQYVEYKIKPEESSLIDLYGRYDPVIVDPESVFAKGYQAGRAVYIIGQNIKIDVERFRGTLVEALGLLGGGGAP